jgi:hypothetical protein
MARSDFRCPISRFRVAIAVLLCLVSPLRAQDAPERLDRGRFAFLFFERDRQLATSLATHAIATDSFPGLPRPQQRVIIAIAPDRERFREWAGAASPEWGSAVAFPEQRRIVLQGRRAGSDAGNPLSVVRHELAHLALHEYLDYLPPRWFNEGYASYVAGEWGREEVLMTNLALALRGMPTLDELEESFSGGASAAQSAYALSYRAVAELASLNATTGLTLLFEYWRDTRSLDVAMRRAYGMTLAGFEQRWRRTTRAQYGVLALVSNITLAAVVFLVVLAPLYFARRRRDRRRLDTMRDADAAAEKAEQAERDSALRALLGESELKDGT